MQRVLAWVKRVDRRAKPLPVLAVAVVLGLFGNTVASFWFKLLFLGLSLALLVYAILLTRRPVREEPAAEPESHPGDSSSSGDEPTAPQKRDSDTGAS